MSNKEYCKGTSLYALIFVIVFSLFTLLLRRPKPRHLFGKQLEKLTDLSFMDTFKLYRSSDNDIDSFVRSVKILSENIGGKFWCGWICCAKNENSKTSKMWRNDSGEGMMIEEANQEGCKYLEIQSQDEMRKMIIKEYFKQVTTVLKSSLSNENIINALNTVRYGTGLIIWNKEELDRINRQIRKLIIIHASLHPCSNVSG